ncbi:MAG: hypothetical protein KBS59_06170 [Clostridiales bacterium]|nr:hypothetical protein [Clostridiales bacterium]
MKKRDFYNYKNPKFAPLREPMRNVMSAYGQAEKYFAAIKEVTWARFGMKSLTNYIHALEHIQPDEVDKFKSIMSEIGLEVEYPATPELDTEQFADLDEVFKVCADIIDANDEALHGFVEFIDTNHKEFSSLARKVENLQMQNSAERTFILEAWSMWDNGTSESSFDNWVEHHAPHIKEE